MIESSASSCLIYNHKVIVYCGRHVVRVERNQARNVHPETHARLGHAPILSEDTHKERRGSQ